MSRAFLVGLWVCIVTLLSSYGAVLWVTGARAEREEDAYLEGIEYTKVQPITVPMIANGTVEGYVIVKFVFTADARTLRSLSVGPSVFLVDEAFREIYTNRRVDFGNLKSYDLDEVTRTIKENVNKRLNANIIQDLLVEELNYVDRDDISG